jgi:hypothetical protein
MSSHSSRINDLATHKVEELRRLSPPISAVGIGGSLGRGDADPHSDIDIFVFFDSGDIFQHGNWFMQAVPHAEAPISVGVLKFFAGYGLRASYVFPVTGKLEYFLNTPQTWTPGPMRANTTVVWDMSGLYSKLIDEARDPKSYNCATESAEDAALHDLLLESLNVLKYARRDDIWSMHYRIAIMRRYLVSFLLTRNHGVEFGVQNALGRIAELSAPEQALVIKTVPGPSSHEMAASLVALATMGTRISTGGRSDDTWLLYQTNLREAARLLMDETHCGT